MYGTDLTGRTLGGFRILRKLGAGGMATVYRAHESSLNRAVALKVIHPHLAQQPGLVARFEREARAAAQLTHPNIVQIYMVGEENGLPFFSMECVNGKSLQAVIETEGFLTARRAVPILQQAAEALAAAHEAGIVHRDIKPSNILLDAAGRVKVTDFGIAQLATENRLTQTGMLLGTPGYISPEQCLGQPLDARSDIYSLGVTMYEMLTGHAPFPADTPAALVLKIIDPNPQPLGAVNPTVPPDLELIVERMMHRDPTQRFQAAEDILAALSHAEVDVLPMTVVQRRPRSGQTLPEQSAAPDVDATRLMQASATKPARAVSPVAEQAGIGSGNPEQVVAGSDVREQAVGGGGVQEKSLDASLDLEPIVAAGDARRHVTTGSTVAAASSALAAAAWPAAPRSPAPPSPWAARVWSAARRSADRAALHPGLLLSLAAAVGAASAGIVIAAWWLLGPPGRPAPLGERVVAVRPSTPAREDAIGQRPIAFDPADFTSKAAGAQSEPGPPTTEAGRTLDASGQTPPGPLLPGDRVEGAVPRKNLETAAAAGTVTASALVTASTALGTAPTMTAAPAGAPATAAPPEETAATPVAAAAPSADTASTPADDPPPIEQTAAAEIDRPPSELESLLTLAEARRASGDLITPEGDSAYAYLERAAALDASGERVRDLRRELAAAIAAAAQRLIERGELEQAETARAAAADLGAGSRALGALDRALDAARAERAAERQASLLASARERLASGQLVEPADDSAWFYLSTLRGENPAHPALADAWRALTTALEGNARTALERQDWVQAENWLEALRRVEPESAAARTLAEDLDAERRQQEYLAVAATIGELRLLEYSPPVYPRYALRYQIEGTVVLEFIVDRSGRPRDIAAVDAEPAGRFEEAAIAAVQTYRFAPFELGGRVYERRVRLPISFSLR